MLSARARTSTAPSSSPSETCEWTGESAERFIRTDGLTFPSAWLPPRELQHLKPHHIDSFLNGSHRKGGGQLREAYLTAQDPSEWDAAQAEARRELEEAGGDEDVDELEDEDEPAEKGKRKRAAPAAKKDTKKAKTAKVSFFATAQADFRPSRRLRLKLRPLRTRRRSPRRPPRSRLATRVSRCRLFIVLC